MDERPVDLGRIQDFVNTLDLRRFVRHGRPLQAGDALSTPAALADWLVAAGLLPGPATADDSDLRLAHTLRAMLRAATVQPGEPTREPPDARPSALEPLAPAALAHLLRVRFPPHAAPTLRPAVSGVAGALALILAGAVAAGVNGSWRRLKMCPAPDCQWVFHDRSRPGNGRWCDPDRCGNRMKTRAYRVRAASRKVR